MGHKQNDYRKAQLQKLKEEVVDLEDMNTGISITDLGLNDFRMDLVEYVKENGNLDGIPFGLHSVVHENKSLGIEKGVIYVLKNINNGVNIDMHKAGKDAGEAGRRNECVLIYGGQG